MSQELSQLSETPPLPGAVAIPNINKIIRTIATDFAGPDDPAAMSWPYCTWADTGNGLIKRRNAAGTAWVVEGVLFKASLPQYLEAEIPTSDKGPIYVIGKGPMEWDGAAYAPRTLIAAAKVSYDNTSSGLMADNAQAAVDELSTANNVGTKKALNASGNAPIYACRAWVNFNGATGAIRGGGNVSSVTRVSAGQYIVNFLTAMNTANYGFSLGAGSGDGNAADAVGPFIAAPTVTSFRFAVFDGTQTTVGDRVYVSATFFE